MGLLIATKTLQDMVNKSLKAVSNNKLIPITGLMSIVLESGILKITTTDADNILVISKDGINGENFNVTIQADIFSKLVSKITVKDTKLFLNENSLNVQGNGNYNLDIPLDEEGGIINFIPLANLKEPIQEFDIKTDLLKEIIMENKISVAKTMEMPFLTGFYFGDKVITTDSYLASINDHNIFKQQILLPAELMDLVSIIPEDKVHVKMDDTHIVFESNTIMVQGNLMDEIEKYPVKAMDTFYKEKFKNRIKINKNVLLEALDRIDLFVSAYDEDTVILNFTKDKLILSSGKSNSAESIEYIEKDKEEPYICKIDIELFKSQLTVNKDENIELYYGSEFMIKLVSDKLTQVIVLTKED